MEKKPLTKERRENIASWYQKALTDESYEALKDLLASEAFWREAVKDSEPTEYYGTFDDERCYFCGRDFLNDVSSREADNHVPDCPWLLAQD